MKTQYSGPVLVSINEAARITGLSRFSVREGCKNHTIPALKNGVVWLVNLPKLLEQIEQETCLFMNEKTAAAGATAAAAKQGETP